MTKFHDGNIRAGKLTPADVLRIRELYHNQRYTQRALGNMYGVATETIGRVVRGDTWKEYGGPGMSESSAAENLHDATLAAQAIATAPSTQSAEIQASLAKLGALLTAGKPATVTPEATIPEALEEFENGTGPLSPKG